MQRFKRLSILALAGAGVLCVFVLGIVVILPKLVNIDIVKEKIQEEFADTLGGKVDYQRIDVSIFPYPRLTIHKGSFVISDEYAGEFESIHIRPKIIPLFKRQIHFATLDIDSLDTTIRLPGARKKAVSEDQPPLSLEKLVKKIRPDVYRLVSSPVTSLGVIVNNGKVRLFREKKALIFLKNIQSRLQVDKESITTRVQCDADHWQKVSLVSKISRKDYSVKGELNLTQLRPHSILPSLSEEAAKIIGDSQIDLTLEYRSNGLKDLHVDIVGSLPQLTVLREDKKFEFKGKQFNGNFTLSGNALALSIDSLKMDYPKIDLSVKFSKNFSSSNMALEVSGKDVDAASVRDAALFMAGTDRHVKKIFSIVKGGRVPAITISTYGKTVDELDNLPHIHIKGNLLEGAIYVPGPELELTHVTGETVVSNGILEAKHVSARIGNTSGQNGKLTIDVGNKEGPFHLDIQLEADLSQLPPVLRRVVKNNLFKEELTHIENLAGSARGRLLLGESLTAVQTTVEVSEFNLTAQYDRFPFPLALSGGQFNLSGDNIVLSDVIGSSKKTSISFNTAKINIAKSPTLEMTFGNSRVNLDDIYPWLLSFASLKRELKGIPAANGMMDISSLDFKGKILQPKRWQFDMAGTVDKLSVKTTYLPGTLRLTSGAYRATPRTLTFKDMEANLLDATVKVSGVSNKYLEGFNDVKMNFGGALGIQAINWASQLVKIPKSIKIRPPLWVSEARLAWNDKATSFSGSLAVQKGPSVDIDVLGNAKELNLKYLRIKDDTSDAAFKLHKRSTLYDFSYKGKISKRTLDALVVDNTIVTGWVSGDITGSLFLNQPKESIIKGTLEGEGFVIPGPYDLPLTVSSVSLMASQNSIKVTSAKVSWLDHTFDAGGQIDFFPQIIQLDMDIETDGLDWEKLSQMLDAQKKKIKDEKEQDKWKVNGVLRLTAGYFKYESFVWRPFRADIKLRPENTQFEIIQAKLCGISTPGRLIISEKETAFNFKTTIEHEPLEDAVLCLTDKSWQAGGYFDLHGEFRSQGKPKALMKSLLADLRFTARDGRINRFGLLAKILELLNIAQIIQLKLPDMEKEGFAYKVIQADANIVNGKLMLKALSLDSAAMQLACNGTVDLVTREADLLVLAAPLQTANIIVRNLPVVNYILGGNFMTIPLRVTGNIFDPKVIAMNPKDVGANLVGIMERTVKTPFKIVSPDTFETIRDTEEKMIKAFEAIEPSQEVSDPTVDHDQTLH